LQEQQQQGMVSTVMEYDEPKANTNPHGSVPATSNYPTGPLSCSPIHHSHLHVHV
jgi:hypothetical protein